MKKIEQLLRLLVFLALLLLAMIFTPSKSKQEPPQSAHFLIKPPTCGDGVIGYCLPSESDTEEFKPAEYFQYVMSSGVYFEYPSSWEMYTNGYVLLTPSKDSPEGLSLGNIQIGVSEEFDFEEAFKQTNMSPCFATTSLKWFSAVYLEEFQGFHCSWNLSGGNPILVYTLFNPENQIFIYVSADPLTNQIADKITDSKTANKMFPDFARLIESIRIWKR